MKRIAYVLARFPSLTETFIHREIEELKRMGCRLTIFAVGRSKSKELGRHAEKFSNFTYYRPPLFSARLISAQVYFLFKSPAKYISALLFIVVKNRTDPGVMVKTVRNFPCAVYFAKKMEEIGVELIHAHFAYIPTSMAMVAAGLLNIDFSFTAHAWDIYVSDTMLMEKMKSAKFVVTCNEYNKKYLEDFCGGEFKEKIHRVYHGIDVDGFGENARVSSNRIIDSSIMEKRRDLSYILSVGRLEEKKGFDYMIEACGILKRKGYRFFSSIVGEGKQRGKLERMIDRHGLKEDVCLTGELSQEELLPLYTRADIFVMPCIIGADGDRDGLPNVLIEALALGIPSVATDISAIPELVKDGETGLLVAQKDAEALALAVEKLILDKDLGKSMAVSGKRRVMEMFDIKKNTGRLLELMNES